MNKNPAEIIQRAIDDDTELGVSFCAIQDGEMIIDVHGGFADRKKQTPWTEDTLACVYSSGKAVLSLLIAKAVSDGYLRYDMRVAEIWPEFSANGKEKITLDHIMSHQAGLCGFATEMPADEWLSWTAICDRLAAMMPLWQPGTASGYHPQTFGFLAGEMLKRATGKSVGALLTQANIDIHCGMSGKEISRVAYMPKPPRAPNLAPITDLKQYAFLKPWSAPARVSREDWMAAELPASNMHTNARALASFLHPFANRGVSVDGRQYCDAQVIQRALEPRISGNDLVLPFHLTWAAGLMANTQGHFGSSSTAFGHAGFGGSCIVVDPARRLSIAYVMNKMSEHLVGDPRSIAMIECVTD